jgi:iron complex transport system substrate-binding protein
MGTQRVVSLIASATETVVALGCVDQLVGRSHECDFPPGIRDLPVCSSTRIAANGTSAEVDQQVKALLAEAISIYAVNAGELQRLQPDLIITQTQCAVCAVSPADLEQALCQSISSRPRIVAVEPHDLNGIWNSIHQIAAALHAIPQGTALVDSSRRRLREITQKIPPQHQRPTVACLEWIDPLMAAGNWVPELVQIAGGENLFGVAGQHSPWMTWEDLVARDPDVIVVMPCGWDISKARQEATKLEQQPEWSQLKAVKARRVAIADGNQYFNRPGPRIVDSAEMLAELFHPRIFDFHHHGSSYIWL